MGEHDDDRRGGSAQRNLRRTGQLDTASDSGPPFGRRSDSQRACRAVPADASRYLEAHQGARTGGLGHPRAASAVPTMRPRRFTTRGGLYLDGAVPARLGSPLRSDGGVPRTTPTATRDRNTMTDISSSQGAVVIERTFDAPVDLIWQMWTDPDHFKAWYGPDGASIPHATMDVRVGGTRLVCMEMQFPNGPVQMWFTGEYREIVENQHLLYTESMSDEHGNVQSASE